MPLNNNKPKVYNPDELQTIVEGYEEVESPQSDTSANSDDSDTIEAMDAKRAELLLKRIALITAKSPSTHSQEIAHGGILIRNNDGEIYETTLIIPNSESILEPEVHGQSSIIEVDRENNIYSEWVLWGIISLSFTIAINYIYNYDAPSR